MLLLTLRTGCELQLARGSKRIWCLIQNQPTNHVSSTEAAVSAACRLPVAVKEGPAGQDDAGDCPSFAALPLSLTLPSVQGYTELAATAERVSVSRPH